MWKAVKLEEIVNIDIGKTPSRNNPKYWDKDKKYSNVWVSIRDMSAINGLYIDDSREYISNEGAKLFKEVPKNTLIMSFKLSIGKLAITKKNLRTNEAIAAFKIKDSTLICNEFLYYSLSSMNWDVIAGHDIKVKGKTLNKAKLKEILIILPPLKEQKCIITKLDKVFSGINKIVEIEKNKTKNIDSLFKNYLTKIFNNNDNDYKDYTIKQLGTVTTGNTPKTSNKKNYGDFISFVKPGDFKHDGSIDYEKQKLSKIGLSNSRVINKKSVLMVCIGATIGKCGYIEKDITTNQQINSITPTNNFNYKFIYYQMISDKFQNKINSNFNQATLPIINKSKWQNLSMRFPNIKRQLECVKKISNLRVEIFNMKSNCLKKIHELSSLKLSIIKKELGNNLIETV